MLSPPPIAILVLVQCLFWLKLSIMITLMTMSSTCLPRRIALAILRMACSWPRSVRKTSRFLLRFSSTGTSRWTPSTALAADSLAVRSPRLWILPKCGTWWRRTEREPRSLRSRLLGHHLNSLCPPPLLPPKNRNPILKLKLKRRMLSASLLDWVIRTKHSQESCKTKWWVSRMMIMSRPK